MSVVGIIDQVIVGQSFVRKLELGPPQSLEFENSDADLLASPAHKCLMTKHKQLQ
jgi:hypothetical protein